MQRLHLAHPLVATVDDHEFADGAWSEGSVEHRPERDGGWAERRARAWQARWEWLPARLPDPADPERVFRTVRIGPLADLFLLDTRTRRDRPAAAPDMHDRSRTALGLEQREWLLRELAASTACWRLLGNPSVLGQTWGEKLPPDARKPLALVKLCAADGNGPDFDQWDGYPAERDRVLRHLVDHGITDVVVLSGDVHVSLALEVERDPFDVGTPPVAVEVVTASLTSQNVDDKMHWAPRTDSLAVERAVLDALPHVKWCDLDSNGYVVVDVTPERVQGEWWHVDTVLRPSQREACSSRWMVRRGTSHLVPAAP
jgi:alkaline phosphatase D